MGREGRGGGGVRVDLETMSHEPMVANYSVALRILQFLSREFDIFFVFPCFLYRFLCNFMRLARIPFD